MAVDGRNIVLGVTGGIAAYKTADLCSRLVQAGAVVSVVMSRAATEFVGPTTFQALTARPVRCEMFEPSEYFRGEHIGMAEQAELFVVAPATANYIAKIAHGLADDLISTIALAVSAPILLAPAMNTQMWEKPSVQRNIAQLQDDGVELVGPGSGWLSCGHVGAGRMAEPDEIFARIEALLG